MKPRIPSTSSSPIYCCRRRCYCCWINTLHLSGWCWWDLVNIMPTVKMRCRCQPVSTVKMRCGRRPTLHIIITPSPPPPSRPNYCVHRSKTSRGLITEYKDSTNGQTIHVDLSTVNQWRGELFCHIFHFVIECTNDNSIIEIDCARSTEFISCWYYVRRVKCKYVSWCNYNLFSID